MFVCELEDGWLVKGIAVATPSAANSKFLFKVIFGDTNGLAVVVNCRNTDGGTAVVVRVMAF